MSRGETIAVSFPPKMWSRKASLRADVVEARQVLVRFACYYLFRHILGR